MCEFKLEQTLGRATQVFFFPGKVAAVVVSAVSRLDRGKLSTNVHRTVARARFHIKIAKHIKKLSGPERFWKMRSTKGARDCSESLISSIIMATAS